MNALNESADRLRNGWCRGDLKDGDRYCAVGAMGASLIGDFTSDRRTARVNDNMDEYIAWENRCYEAADTSHEGEVLARTILAQHPELRDKEAFKFAEQSGNWSEVVFMFNDMQDTVDPVIAMFEKAAIAIDEQA